MIEKLLNNFKVKNSIVFVFLFTLIITASLNSYFIYQSHKEIFYNSVDKQLKDAAYAAVSILPDDFHDRALTKDSILKDEDIRNTLKLTEFTNKIDIAFVYTMVQDSVGRLYFTSTNGTQEELENGEYLYYREFTEGTELFKNLLKQNEIKYEESTDEWGTFRSILIPMTTKKGNKYILGADIEISFIKEELQEYLYISIILLVLFLLMLIIIFIIYIKLSKKELDDISIIESDMKDEIKEKTKELEKLAITDKLTGIYNRVKLDEFLQNEIDRSERYNHSFTLTILDIDDFKSVNDTYGHLVGDKVLTEIANILKTSSRKTDIVGRWGGEEFLIICPESTLKDTANMIENIRLTIASFDFTRVGNKTASFGISLFKPNDTIDSLTKRADDALYKAKNSGRNKVLTQLDE